MSSVSYSSAPSGIPTRALNEVSVRLAQIDMITNKHDVRIAAIDDGLNVFIELTVNVFAIVSEVFTPFVAESPPLSPARVALVQDVINTRIVELRSNYITKYENETSAMGYVIENGQRVQVKPAMMPSLKEAFVRKFNSRIADIMKACLVTTSTNFQELKQTLESECLKIKPILATLKASNEDLIARHRREIEQSDQNELNHAMSLLANVEHTSINFWHACEIGDLQYVKKNGW